MIKIGNSDLKKIMFGESEVVKVYKGEDLIYSSAEPASPYSLEFHSESARTITPKYTNSGVTLQYSLNQGVTWTTIASGTATPSAKEIWFRGQAIGTKTLYTTTLSSNSWVFSGNSTNGVTIKGNIMYLLCNALGDAVPQNIIADYTFCYMFRDTPVVNAIDLILPATTLAGNCYRNMFRGCTSLTSAPALPATTLAGNCYTSMFYGCSSLNTAPALHATTLASNCYNGMFYGCSSLNTAPALPATTLASTCYTNMFRGCTSLTSAPALPATTLADNCYNGMFRGCALLTSAPVLPVTTLASSCYAYMFYECVSLTSIYLAYAGNDNPNSAFTSWVQNIKTAGTLYKKGTLFAASGNNTYPATWTQVAWV